MRDKYIDLKLKAELEALDGNEVFIRKCLREGRDSVLELQPDIIVMPPIRNVYSRDFIEVARKMGIRVVTRHTEPSCSWQDFKKMDDAEKMYIHGPVQYEADLELVWGPDEAQILSRRPYKIPVHHCGAFVADIYKDADLVGQMETRGAFRERFGLSTSNPILLIGSPWGFIDSAPDLNTDETRRLARESDGLERWLEMIKVVTQETDGQVDVIVTLHPNVAVEPYEKLAEEVGVVLDHKSPAFELLCNVDCLIHSGSTMALEMHLLNRPAYQYGDQNKKEINWWSRSGTAISQVSPYFEKVDDLVAKIVTDDWSRSNASDSAIADLEAGRYGALDGNASKRAAQLITEMPGGKFRHIWPDLGRDYRQLTILQEPSQILDKGVCGICKGEFYLVKPEWLKMAEQYTGTPAKKFMPRLGMCCPRCGCKVWRKGDDYEGNDNPGEAGVPETTGEGDAQST